MRHYPRWSTERCPRCGSRIRLRWETTDVAAPPGTPVREDVVSVECDAFCELTTAEVAAAFPPKLLPG